MTMDLRNYEGEELVSTFLFVKIFALQNSHEKKIICIKPCCVYIQFKNFKKWYVVTLAMDNSKLLS